MRVYDDRYLRDRRALDLAVRLLGHGARTNTISRWTGIPERRVRTLQRSYVREIAGVPPKRPRGRSPYRVELLIRSPRQREEVTCLVRICHKAGVFPEIYHAAATRMLAGIDRGERLCEAFESFRHQRPNSRISIEHSLLLITELVHRENVELGICGQCGGLIVVDRLAAGLRPCAHCVSSLLHEVSPPCPMPASSEPNMKLSSV